MAKRVDKKNQERVTLDNLLTSIKVANPSESGNKKTPSRGH